MYYSANDHYNNEIVCHVQMLGSVRSPQKFTIKCFVVYGLLNWIVYIVCNCPIQRLVGATLLVFANKQDLPGAMTSDEIEEVCVNNDLPLSNIVHICILCPYQYTVIMYIS